MEIIFSSLKALMEWQNLLDLNGCNEQNSFHFEIRYFLVRAILHILKEYYFKLPSLTIIIYLLIDLSGFA